MKYLLTRRSEYDMCEIKIFDNLTQLMVYMKEIENTYYIGDFKAYKVNELVLTWSEEDDD